MLDFSLNANFSVTLHGTKTGMVLEETQKAIIENGCNHTKSKWSELTWYLKTPHQGDTGSILLFSVSNTK